MHDGELVKEWSYKPPNNDTRSKDVFASGANLQLNVILVQINTHQWFTFPDKAQGFTKPPAMVSDGTRLYWTCFILQLKYSFGLEENVSRAMGQNTLNPWGELSPLTLLKNNNLNFRLARDQVVDHETTQISQGALTSDQQNIPCIRLARLKFELTIQDSAGGKNFTVLTSM